MGDETSVNATVATEAETSENPATAWDTGGEQYNNESQAMVHSAMPSNQENITRRNGGQLSEASTEVPQELTSSAEVGNHSTPTHLSSTVDTISGSDQGASAATTAAVEATESGDTPWPSYTGDQWSGESAEPQYAATEWPPHLTQPTTGLLQHGSYGSTTSTEDSELQTTWLSPNSSTAFNQHDKTSVPSVSALFNTSTSLEYFNNTISSGQEWWLTNSTTEGSSPPGAGDSNTTVTATLDLVMASSNSLQIRLLDSDPGTETPCDGVLCWYNVSGSNASQDYSETAGASMARNWHVLLLGIIVIAGIMGNILVCIAVSIEKKLQNVTNYFLVSLAIADLFVSLIVMPCSIVHEFMGYWPFGLAVCDLWQVLDVMLCTSSIMHMCTISIDRYFGIKNPLKLRNKSRMVVGLKITAVWLISLAIASPIILLSSLDPANVLNEDRVCAIFNHYFLIYGSMAAFFIPLLIMLVAYSLTIYLLNKQARNIAARSKEGMRRSRSINRKKDKSKKATTQRRIGNGSAANGLYIAKKTHRGKERGQDSEREPLHNTKYDAMDSVTGKTAINSMDRIKPGIRPVSVDPDAPPRLQSLVKKHSVAIKAAGLMIARRDHFATKHKLNSVRTERKAVKVLGAMFAFFVLCWAPFFSINFAMGVCTKCDIEVILFKIFLWLGYLSSTLNPIIYTIFNKNFRHTFARLLCGPCRWLQHKHRKRRAKACQYQTNGTSVRCQYDLSNLDKLDDLDETIL